MKKLYFLVLMICSVCAFTACSDNDDDPKPQMPVTGLSVPSSATIGEDVNILGTGFSEAARLYTRDAQGKETEVTISQRLSTGLTVVFPATLTGGAYTLILKQAGDWELGKITLIAAKPLPITDLKVPEKAVIGETLVLEGKNFPDNGEYYLQDNNGKRTQLEAAAGQQEGTLILEVPATLGEGSYTLILKVGEDEWKVSELAVKVPGPKRLKTIAFSGQSISAPYSINLHYNAAGKVDSIRLTVENDPQCENWYIEYSPASVKMTMTGKTWQGEASSSSMNLTLQDGKIKQNVYIDEYEDTYTNPWEYNTEGYSSTVQYGSADYYTLTVDTYAYKNGNLDTCTMYWSPELIPENISGGFQLYYEGEVKDNNVGNVDLLSLILYIFNMDKATLYPRLLGLHGKTSAQLPTKVSGDFNKEFTYEGEDYVSRISMVEHFDYGGGNIEAITTYILDLSYENIPE